MDSEWIIAFMIIVVAGTIYFIECENRSKYKGGYDEGFNDCYDLFKEVMDEDADKLLALLKKAIKPIIKTDKRYNRGDLKKIDECLTLDELKETVVEIIRRK